MLKYNKKVDNMQEEINNISRQVISKKEFWKKRWETHILDHKKNLSSQPQRN